ncbi:hypothetical protein RGUI_2598 [Rhodovulum sp. P5]|uniref:hypothetical protein n=1 Tax=Rhodovulum sp. P5 TaxID=1564506 RepID=UPI0009C27F77|nr:hypothetical protein [Rhodovulum sp. P5]ARE40739.1 hypothetical protein RGUI_2598 [Rhodovulum sp. P5]
MEMLDDFDLQVEEFDGPEDDDLILDNDDDDFDQDYDEWVGEILTEKVGFAEVSW